MYRTIIYCFHIFLLFLTLGTVQVSAQSIDANDLSTVRVDELSDEQIRSYMRQAEASGLSEEEMEFMAVQRGMPQSEVVKLRTRIQSLTGQESVAYGRTDTNRPSTRLLTDTVYVRESDEEDSDENDSLGLQIFGASLFQSASPAFETNLRIATPKSYIIGPGDQLLIDVFGYSEASHTLNVTPDGTINIPHVGVIPVSGMTIAQATTRIRSQLSTVYRGIGAGGTQVEVTLGNIRSISVVITGEVVRPGTYTLPSLASVFNALYQSGGPTVNGSFRNVNLIRDGQVIAVLDIYDVLLNGSFSENIRLEDQDVLMIPPYSNRVEIRGEVKREAIFELKSEETFEDLLKYAGGFTEQAYRARVRVTKTTDREHRIEDLLGSQFGHYVPATGDKYEVEKILARYENRVTIDGSVYRPGDYELTPGLTLSMLIKKADGVKEEAFLNRGSIVRLQDDLQTERLSFNVAAVLAGTEPDVELKREDIVNIYSIFDLQEARTVDIEGEIQKPGRFTFAEGMTLQDLIVEAGGFRESASSMRIEVSRRVREIDPRSRSSYIAEVFQVDLERALSDSERDFTLMPFDEVVVRTAAGYETQKTVRIEGEVLFPGAYTITSKDERISDLIKRAGGFTAYAYIEGASLRRGVFREDRVAETGVEQAKNEFQRDEEYNRLLTLQSLQSDANAVGSVNVERNINNNFVGINLTRIVKNPGKRGDLILDHGDVIMVPKELQTVKISGEVLAPSIAVYSPAKGFKQYISQAGGFSQRALRKSSYVLYANGSVKSTSRFLFFNNYPSIEPGAEIFVPQKPTRIPIGPQQWLGMTTGVASLAAIILTIFK